jgi:hypothetical protein
MHVLFQVLAEALEDWLNRIEVENVSLRPEQDIR